MREVQATEAKARLSELLRTVEAGEAVAITRHGRVVAHLVPPVSQVREIRKRSVDNFRRQRAKLNRIEMTTEEILAARHEGHRI